MEKTSGPQGKSLRGSAAGNAHKFGVAVLFGDARMTYAAGMFVQQGCFVRQYQIPPEEGIFAGESVSSLAAAVAGMDLVVASVPWSSALEEEALVEALSQGQKLLTGQPSEELKKRCAAKGILLIDLYEREDFRRFGAVATAEGAIVEALLLGGRQIHMTPCLVLGYGRCGSVLARKLQGFSAWTTVCTRGWTRTCAALSEGFEVCPFSVLELQLPRFRYVFNTIPAPIFSQKLLEATAEDVVLIDIASPPGGVDNEAAQALGGVRKIKQCLGLPGTYAPRTVGESIAQIAAVIFEEA